MQQQVQLKGATLTLLFERLMGGNKNKYFNKFFLQLISNAMKAFTEFCSLSVKIRSDQNISCIVKENASMIRFDYLQIFVEL